MAGLGGSLGYAMGGIDWGIFGKNFPSFSILFCTTEQL